MSHFSTLLTTSPFSVFLAVLLGVLIGQFEYRGFSLGSSGTLFAGMALGFLGFRVDPGYLSLSLVLFIAAVGLLAADDIGDALTTTGVKFAAIGVVIPGVGAVLTALFAIVAEAVVDPWIVRGSFVGTLTSTPGLAAAMETAPIVTQGGLSAGYSFTYMFGIVIVILFQDLAPPLLGIDPSAERRRFQREVCRPDSANAHRPTSVPFSLAGFSLAIVVGALVDQIHVPLGPLGSMTLSLSGGTLIAALVIGYVGHVGPIRTRMEKPILEKLQEVSLGIFLAVVGVEASSTFVGTATNGGLVLLVSSLFIGGGAMLAGLVLATVVWDLDWISTAGAIAGGMTCGPGLAAAIATTDSDAVGVAYAATYPFALIGMVVFSKLLVLLA